MKLHPLLAGFKAATLPPDRRTPWQWAEDNVVVDNTSPYPGKWQSINSPWVKAPMECAADPRVRRVVIRCAAQTGKTQTCICLMCWIIDQEPGPAMYVMAAKDEAKDFMRDRVLPTFDTCKPVGRRFLSKEGLTFVFSSMPFYFTGSHSKSKLQSKPIRWLFCDEVRNYPDGALELALKRTRQFYNAKEFLISTANMVADNVDTEFKAGTQEEWATLCPKCGKVEPLLWDRLEWDRDEEAKPAEEFRIDRLTDSIRLKCGGCDHRWRDVPHERRQIATQGRFVSKNPNAARNRRSFTWNALVAPVVTWASVVEEYFAAIRQAKAAKPDLYPLKRFYNETLGLPWEQALGEINDYSFIEERKADYVFNDPWPEEKVRFIAADKQSEGGEHYWWLIRAFAENGRSRLIAYGVAYAFAELEELREKYQVKRTNSVIDSGYKATEVYNFCAKFGWRPMKGDDAESFPHDVVDPKTGRNVIVHRLWKKPEHVDLANFRMGRRRFPGMFEVRRHHFSSGTTKDFLAEYMTGLIEGWTIPKAVGSDYLTQMTAERRVEEFNRRGNSRWIWKQTRRANHLFDCELMVTVAAVTSGAIQSGMVRQPKLHLAAQGSTAKEENPNKSGV